MLDHGDPRLLRAAMHRIGKYPSIATTTAILDLNRYDPDGCEVHTHANALRARRALIKKLLQRAIQTRE